MNKPLATIIFTVIMAIPATQAVPVVLEWLHDMSATTATLSDASGAFNAFDDIAADINAESIESASY